MFHVRLLSLRDKTNLSQRELSKRLGMARTTYAGYENGSREPDLKTLSKIADYFNVDLNWLITGSEGSELKMDETDKELLTTFKDLKEEDQKYILEFMRRMSKLE